MSHTIEALGHWQIKLFTCIFNMNIYNSMPLYVTYYKHYFLIQVVNGGREASSDLSATSLPFPASNGGQRDPCLPVVPSAIGKLRRGELGRGRNRAPNYKVTRENQSLLELSWYWRHRAHQTADQWVSPGRRRKEEGSRAGYCTKESVPRCVQITPKVVGDPVTCSDVLVWMFTCLFWLYARVTPTNDLAL